MGRVSEGEKYQCEREILMRGEGKATASHTHPTGKEPAIEACALTGDRTTTFPLWDDAPTDSATPARTRYYIRLLNFSFVNT